MLPVIFVLFVLLGLYFSLTGTVYVMCCNPVAVLPSLGCQVFFWQISCAVVLSQCMAFYMLALSQCRPCASGIDSRLFCRLIFVSGNDILSYNTCAAVSSFTHTHFHSCVVYMILIQSYYVTHLYTTQSEFYCDPKFSPASSLNMFCPRTLQC